MKIIVDAMGGDNAPESAVYGAVLAANEYKRDIILVGDQARIKPILDKLDDVSGITVYHAPDMITMEDDPSTAVREKKNASMTVAMRIMAEGEGDVLISAGNTGALLSGSTLILKRIAGIRRAALSPYIPTRKDSALLIDCGANVECTPEHLMQFALMGSLYTQHVKGIDRPRVGLLNIGTEPLKGTELYRETNRLLASSGLNFVGNVEGHSVINDDVCDIMVCDGFTGNIFLKAIEGIGMFFFREMKNIFYANPITMLAALAGKKKISRLRTKADASEIGGSPLLGISRPVIKAHGGSNATAVKNAIRQGISFYDSDTIGHITRALEGTGQS